MAALLSIRIALLISLASLQSGARRFSRQVGASLPQQASSFGLPTSSNIHTVPFPGAVPFPNYQPYSLIPPGFVPVDPDVHVGTSRNTYVLFKGSIAAVDDNPFHRPFLLDGNFDFDLPSYVKVDVNPNGPYYIDPSRDFLQSIRNFQGPQKYPAEFLGIQEPLQPDDPRRNVYNPIPADIPSGEANSQQIPFLGQPVTGRETDQQVPQNGTLPAAARG